MPVVVVVSEVAVVLSQEVQVLPDLPVRAQAVVPVVLVAVAV